jgi:hypothetical protein
MTETDPRVSTVFKDLHRTWLLFIILAVIVSEAVSAIGKPSGIKAIATVTMSTIKPPTLIHSGWSFRSHAAQQMTTRLKNNMRAQMIMIKLRISF